MIVIAMHQCLLQFGLSESLTRKAKSNSVVFFRPIVLHMRVPVVLDIFCKLPRLKVALKKLHAVHRVMVSA